MFPRRIEQLDHLRENKMIKFKDESIEFDGVNFKFTIVSYMIGDNDLWKIDNATEARGITYNQDGFAVSAPFEKFFNVGERPETQFEDLPEGRIVITEKRDGSMLSPVLLSTGWSKKVVFKTKKSFYSDVAKLANKLVPQNVLEMCQTLLEQHFTPIFEFTHPDAEIVIDYGTKPVYTLLAIRSNIDGSYWAQDLVTAFAEKFEVDYIRTFEWSLPDVQEKIESDEGVEGWVVWFVKWNHWRADYVGLRVKWKTKWYLKRHRAKTQLRERDVADMVVEETIDDMKSYLTSIGYSLAPIELIEKEVSEQIADVRWGVEMMVEQYRHLDRKNFAILMKDKLFFGLLMTAYLRKEPDYVGYWKRHYREQYSLKTIYSTFGDE
jgi:T4 RnlA family RNA ligase